MTKMLLLLEIPCIQTQSRSKEEEEKPFNFIAAPCLKTPIPMHTEMLP